MSKIQNVEIRVESPRQDDVIVLIEALDHFHEGMYPPEANHILDIDALCAPEIRLFVARRGGEVLGIGALWLRVDEGFGEVKRMFVRPDQRGLGVGLSLVQEIVALARAQGCKRMELSSYYTMTSAHNLYRAMGFRDVPAPADLPALFRGRVIFMEMWL